MTELMGDDVVYVAVKRDVRESETTLLWALKNLGAKKVCILHVHRPKSSSPAASKLEELEAIMYDTLHGYFDLCQNHGVKEDDIYVSCIEMEDVKRGILELIHESKIKKLVMGAAADRHYSEEANFHRVDDAEDPTGQSKPKLSSISTKHSSESISAIIAYSDGRGDREMLDPVASEDHSDEDGRSDQIYRQLKKALVEVEESKREAFEECVRRFKAEKTAVEEIRRAREYEAMYNEEMKLRKEAREALTKQKKMHEKTKQERDDALVIILNGRKLYNEELRRRVEAEDNLAKENEEHERTKKEIEELRLIVQDGMRLYNEQLRQKKETEEATKKQEEELDKTRKEKEEACLISKNLMQLYEEEVRQRKETEEMVKRRREEVEKVKKEKEEACSVGQNFMRLYEEEARRRKAAEEELVKATAETGAAKSVCTDILVLLQNYSRRHGSLTGVSAPEEEVTAHQPPSYFICPISQEVMREPHVAADGFTYEAEALREWLNNGHETSPMTNLKLTHKNLVPNHALRSAIQEWLQRHS
ncbi:PREDICTED: putative U-box domain-containing protein 55 isoform X2 [Tarenaya hassleriana]|uniref:putative U-box domain-containing protein 55 isoform X2 n=1 Tax=Tarenaya hassleriana TaxID=28532 RepID=UPI00053C74FE|nr:PREDICTED: putative U-box domain-containing protein 55 isoform X2 [Tarenaya hassleriana]